jgi:transposase InsO family protein
MSQHNPTPTDPTAPRPDRDDPGIQPASWTDPTFIVPGESYPGQPDDVSTDELIVIPQDDDEVDPEEEDDHAGTTPHRRPHHPYGRAYVKRPQASPPQPLPTGRRPRVASSEGQTRLTILDTWMRSGLPAGDFAPLVKVSKHTLYEWKRRFEAEGPAGLMDRARGAPKGSRLPEITKRAILMMKSVHPDWGVDRLSDMLLRTEALQASPAAIGAVLTENGYVVEEAPTRRHPDQIRFFERAKPNQLWQTDLFTFMLKRQNQRVYLVAYMDDHSRFIVAYGLHASQSAATVLGTLRAGIASYGTPEEVLTDNGTQYITWRGTSQFQHECRKRGIRQVVSSPRRPQTLGKIERFWGSLWRECVDAAIFTDLTDARLRIGHFIDFYNFKRTHSGIDGLVPADRFFSAAPAMLESLRSRVAANALELARSGVPKSPLYLAGNVGGTPVILHGEGDRVILSKDGQRAEVDFEPRTAAAMPIPQAGSPVSPGAAPAASPIAMPPPIAPVGIVVSDWTGATGASAPGVAPVDALAPLTTPWTGGDA